MSVASKLQVKDGQRVVVVNRPAEVDLELPAGAEVKRAGAGDAVVVFVTNRSELEELAKPAVDAGKNGALAWVAYPKAGQLGTDLNRDTLNEAMKTKGVQAVRQVSIDDTWSALRFRKA